jgi:hypothetical protein
MSLQSAADVPLIISSPNSSSERRISPSWTIAHLKSRLEPITGVPAGSQQLSLRVASQDAIPIAAVDEEQTRLAAFPLQPYAEITVSVSLHLSLPSITGLVLEGLSLSASQQLPHCLRPGLATQSLQVITKLTRALYSLSLSYMFIRRLGCVVRLSAILHAPQCPSTPLGHLASS